MSENENSYFIEKLKKQKLKKMKRIIIPVALLAISAFGIVACNKNANNHNAEPTTAIETEADPASKKAVAPNFDPCTFNVGGLLSPSYNFENGALNLQGATATSPTTTLEWVQDGGRYYLRSNTPIVNLGGVATNNNLKCPSHIFAWKRNSNIEPWAAQVPMTILRKYHGGKYEVAIATPNFTNGSPDPLNQTKFASAVNGVATVTDGEGKVWTATNLPNGRVEIDVNGADWGRTNGAGENGSLQALAVLKVRTGYDIVNGKVQGNTYEYVPFILVQHHSKGLTLQTGTARPAYGSSKKYYVSPIQTNLNSNL